MGRMLTFVARIIQNYTMNDICSLPLVRSVGMLLVLFSHSVFPGVDEPAALLINSTTGHAVAVGEGSVYVCTTYTSNPVSNTLTCEPNTPLTSISKMETTFILSRPVRYHLYSAGRCEK